MQLNLFVMRLAIKQKKTLQVLLDTFKLSTQYCFIINNKKQ